MRRALLAALLAGNAFAQTVYTWEDADGVHYADDLALVPKEVRRPVKGRTPGAKTAQPRRDVASPPTAAASVAEAPVVAVAPAPQPEPAPPLDEGAWRRRFVDAYRRIQTSKDTLAALTRTLPPRVDCVDQLAATTPPVTSAGASGTTVVVQAQPTTRCEVNVEHDRMRAAIAMEAVRLADAQRDLEQLERDASMALVPREWRRGW